MNTSRITSAAEAAHIIRRGGLVAFPTETVFGLGVDATNRAAVEKLFAAKGRPSDNPLIVHVAETASWPQAAAEQTPSAETLLNAFAPGPLTVVLPKRADVSPLVTGGLGTVGLRIPDHPIAQEILRHARVPVAAPSANRSGQPSGTRWRSVLEDLDGRIDAVYCADSDSLGIESTVVDCTRDVPAVLRPGAVTIEQIRAVFPDARDYAPDQRDPADQAKSPGLLHPHYQPRAKVVLVDAPERAAVGEERVAYGGLKPFAGTEDLALVATYDTVDEYAAGFYEFLREADRHGVTTIYVQRAPEAGIGRALRDRQRRAAGEGRQTSTEER